MVLVLYLSRLPPPGPRPHRRWIARTILDSTAERHEGQVFGLANGDMVLLCRPAPPARPVAARPASGLGLPDPTALPDTLARLFQIDMPDPAGITTVWRLEEAFPAIAAYIAERLAEPRPEATPPATPEPEFGAETAMVDAIAAITVGSAITDLMQRQTGVLVAAPQQQGRPSVQPLYREVTFSIAVLEARIAAAGQAAADPFLFRHLVGRLDRRMLAMIADAAGTGGMLDIAASGRGRPPLHLNLTLPAILSDDFTRLAQLCRELASPVGIEVAWIDVCNDPAGFGRARGVLADAGLKLVLDGVSHLALMLAHPGALHPDLVKLDWSPRLAALADEESQQIAAALERIDPQRVILHRAESEVAMRWGMAQGIRRFQGRHVDVMLAAGRTMACPRAAGCTLRQCVERAAAAGPVGRAGCGVPSLLDNGPPLVPGRLGGSAA